jgi:plasmid stability protein
MAAKIAAARRGKSLSKEHRQKISATLMSPEINQKLHAARPWQGFIQRRKP